MNHILISHNHQTHINFLIKICYATLSKMEAKYMETSHSRARECKPFTLGFIGFRATDHMVMKVQSHT